MATDDNFYKSTRRTGRELVTLGQGAEDAGGGSSYYQRAKAQAQTTYDRASESLNKIRQKLRGANARVAGEQVRKAGQAAADVGREVTQAGREFASGVSGQGTVLDRTAAERASENAARRVAANPELATEAGRQRVEKMQRIGSARTAPANVRVQGETAPSRFGTPERVRFPRLRGAGRFIGRVAPPAAAAATLYEAGQFAGQSTEDVNREKGYGTGPNFVESGLRRLGLGENEARLGGDIASRYAGMIENLVPFGSEITGGAGGVAANVGGPRPSGIPGGPALAPGGKPDIPTGNSAVVDLTTEQVQAIQAGLKGSNAPRTGTNVVGGQDVGYQNDGTLATDRRYVPESGTGMIFGPGGAKLIRSTPVTAGPQQYVTAAQRDAALLSQADARTAPRPDVQPRLPGVFGEIAQGRALQQRHRQALREDVLATQGLDRGIRVRGQDLTAQTARGSLALQARADGTKAIDDFATTIASSRLDPRAFKDSNQYDSAVKSESARAKSDLIYTLSRRGLNGADYASDPSLQAAMQLGSDIKYRIEKGARPGSAWERLRKYFGDKQINSRDLGNYTPVSIDGNYVVMAGGEKVPTDVIAGGKFDLFGPNSPVDKDLQDILIKLPRKGG